MKFIILCLSILATAFGSYEDDGSRTLNFTLPSGVLMSPVYPFGYPTPMVYNYRISQPEGYIISLSVSDIDLGVNETDPYFTDSLAIFDGDLEIFHRIDILTGSQYFVPARVYNSSANHLLVQFKTFTNKEKHRGFHLTYKAINMRFGGIMRTDNGMIAHPFENYNNENCNWIIQAPPAHVVRIVWKSMQLEANHDYVTIKESQNGNFVKIGRYNGNQIPEPVVSTGPIVYVNFESDVSVLSEFSMSYEFVDVSHFSKRERENINAGTVDDGL